MTPGNAAAPRSSFNPKPLPPMKRVLSFPLPRTPLARWVLIWCWLAPLGVLGQTPQWAWAQAIHTDVQALSGIDQVSKMQSDGAGNVYAVGTFTDDAHFGPYTLIGAGRRDIFVAKFSPTGQCLWALAGGGALDDVAGDLEIDSRGDLYVTGHIVSDFQTDCGLTPIPRPLYGSGMLWKISAGGHCRWVKVLTHSIGPATSGYAFFLDLSLDAADGPVCIIESSNAVRIGTTDYPVQGLYTWIVRCDSVGRVRWVKEFQNSNSIGVSSIAGSAEGIFVRGGGINAQLGSILLPGNGGFVAMIDTAGVWQWAKQYLGATSPLSPRLTYHNTHVYISGRMPSAAALIYDGQPILAAPSFGVTGTDGWVLALNSTTGASSHSYRTRVPAGTSGGCELNAIAVETGGAVYLTGTISGTVELRPGHPRTAIGFRDGFVVKLDSAGRPVWDLTAGVPAPGFQVPTGIRPQAIAVAGPAGPVIAGVLADSVTLGTATITSNPRQSFDLFIAGIAQPLGVAAGPEAGALRVWPNPATGHAAVGWPAQPVAARLRVRDALGRTVRTDVLPAYATHARIACAGLPAGVYGLEVVAGRYRQHVKLVVTRAEE